MIRSGSVRKPYEGVSLFPDRFAGRAGEDEQKPIDTLRRRRRGVKSRRESA
jgi:hypothetical protein